MSNTEQILQHNEMLRECIEIADNLPEAGEKIEPNLVELEVDKNGVYRPPLLGEDAFDGYSKVTVNVPIPEGYIKPSGTLDITENGKHDVTQYSEVDVKVESSGGSGDSTNTVNSFLEGTVEEVNCSGITTLHPYAFYKKQSLKKVTLANVETVEGYNFYDCDELESIDLPKATGTIGIYFCYSCANLTTVNLPKATGLNSYAFQSATNLEFIDLPMVASISNYSFRYCSNLTTLILRKDDGICTLGGTTALAGSGISNKKGYIYVPSALIEEYKVATNWTKFESQFRAIEDYPEICGGV